MAEFQNCEEKGPVTEELLTKIPAIIEKKKAEKLAEVEAKIKELEALKHELSK